MPDQEPALKALNLRLQHAQLGARFGSFAGWEMPLWYGGAVEEHMAVRHDWGVFDVSHMGRLLLQGASAGETLAGLLTRDARQIEIGFSQYALACNETGGIIDDLIVYRQDVESFLVVCNAANAGEIRSLIEAAADGGDAALRDLREEDGMLLAVQGPQAVAKLSRLLGDPTKAIARHGCATLEYGGAPVFLARTGYTGEDGFEVVTGAAAGAKLFEGLIAAGCQPCGLAARDSLRLEASLALHGHEIDAVTTPWEAGLGWAVSLDHEFRGKTALIEAKSSSKRRLASLVADGNGVIRAGYAVSHAGGPAGTVTSGGYSPILKTSIAMAYVDLPLARPDTQLSVELRGRHIACHTIRRPFYRGSASTN